MFVSFDAALQRLGADFAFRIMNAARPPADYVFAQFLPERPKGSYEARAGSMTIRTVMAGLVGMDSPYPEGAIVDTATFLQQSAKLAHAVDLSEESIRELQQLMLQLQIAGGDTVERTVEELLNFTNALLVQPHLDATEWLRGQVFATGKILWNFNGKTLDIDYGVPAANKPAARTGNNGYGGSTSQFWTDNRAAQKAFRYNLGAIVTSITTLDMILAQQANNIVVLDQQGSRYTLQRMIQQNGVNTPSSDRRDRIDIIGVDKEGEILDPANPGKTKRVPFMPDGKVTWIARNTGTGYSVGAGSRPPNDYELGYTHIAPTVESRTLTPGRWARVFTPEHRPWALRGESAANVIPVLEAPEKLYIATTDVV